MGLLYYLCTFDGNHNLAGTASNLEKVEYYGADSCFVNQCNTPEICLIENPEMNWLVLPISIALILSIFLIIAIDIKFYEFKKFQKIKISEDIAEELRIVSILESTNVVTQDFKYLNID